MFDISAFETELAQLETSLLYLRTSAGRGNAGLHAQFRAAAVKAYELTYELAIRMIRRQLSEILPNPGALPEMKVPDLIARAAEAGLVRAAAPFEAYSTNRDAATHDYDELGAEEVVDGVERFVADMRFLRDQLRRRNHAGP
jgi:nucleotidyltransferase substrate binding protein (TIGR01987 family)